MTKLKAVFWDLDGTLANTEINGHRIAFNLAFKESLLDWVWDKDMYTNLLSIAGGKNRILKYSQLVGISLTESEIKKIHKIKQNKYTEIVKSGNIPLRTGVSRLLEELNKNNIDQWIVTTSGIDAVNSLINSTLSSKKNYFNGYITSEDVKSHKPSPDAYLQALLRSNCDTTDCIAIEDSEIGLQSAHAAGIKCLISISPWSKFELKKYNLAESIVNTLGDDHNKSIFYSFHEHNTKYIDLKFLNYLLK